MKEVIEFYNNYNEEGRLLKKNRMPEFITTMKYIEKYLTENSKILEIGAGTGRYSIALADKGYEVTSVELAPHNIKILKSKIKPEYNINIYEGNACDLSFIKNDTYDIVLLLGPMYHLFNDTDKHKAISEAIRVAKKGGIIYSAYCNNDTCIYKLFYKKNILQYINNKLIDKSFHTVSAPKEVFYLYQKPEIDEIMKDYPVTRLHFVGVDMLSYLYSDKLNKLNKKEFEEYIKFILTICEREDLVGFSQHMLDIFRKD